MLPDAGQEPEIRPATEADLPVIIEIERVSFPSPWGRSVFLDELTREWARLVVYCPSSSRAPVAFINYWVVRDEIHILNVATHPSERRRGIATRLLSWVIGPSVANGARYVTLEVRRSNQAALALYRRFGFEAIGVRPRYYIDNNEDAILMLLSLGDR